MESTPPSHRSSQSKSAGRSSKLRHNSEEAGFPVPPLSLEIISVSPLPSPASPHALPQNEIPMFSPSPFKRSKTRLVERLEMADEAVIEAAGFKKRCKSRNANSGCAAASPRSVRRSRRRLEQDMKEERDFAAGVEMLVKPRRKRHSDKSRVSKSISAPPIPSPRANDDDERCNLDVIGEIIHDLIMWKDVSKSSLWFGFGSLCFLSSCFTKGVNFSIFSFLSQVALLLLGVSFFSNSMRRRDAIEDKTDFKLKESDILRLGRLILPAANLAISKAREIFSGEPSMTLKVFPIFLLGAEYGHIITLWRLCALGFFISFTCPKLYSAYTSQISKKVDYLKSLALSAWGSCSHKKIVATSAALAFWNLTSIRTRIFAAFLCLVILKHRRQNCEGTEEDKDKVELKHENVQQEKAVVAVETGSKK